MNSLAFLTAYWQVIGGFLIKSGVIFEFETKLCDFDSQK